MLVKEDGKIMTATIDSHIKDYQAQIEQHRAAIAQFSGAIAALERLKKELKEKQNG